MTYREIVELENIDLEELRHITGIKDLIEDDLCAFKIYLDRHIKPRYKDYDLLDAIIKSLEESNDFPREEISDMSSSLRNSIIDRINGDADYLKKK